MMIMVIVFGFLRKRGSGSYGGGKREQTRNRVCGAEDTDS